MLSPVNDRYLPLAHAALRIAAGAAFFSHGAQKLFGWFGGINGSGGTVELMSKFGAAGVIELVAGALIAVGLLTRLAAFIASGEMAVAYFWMHAAGGGLFWWANRGEVVMLYSFIFFFFAAAGAGPFSVDARQSKR